MHVAIIGGGGTLGSTVAFTLASKDMEIDISLVNRTVGKAWAHATDIEHGRYHFVNSPGGGSSLTNEARFGEIRSYGIDEVDEIDPSPDLLVYTIAVDRPEEMTGREASYWEFQRNVEITDQVIEEIATIEPIPIIVLTNPIDRITYQLWDRLGWPRRNFIGYSLNEAARVADAIGRVLDVHPNRVHCPVMGEHGDNPVPLFSRVRVNDEFVDVPTGYRQEIIDYMRDVPFEIVEQRGESETSRWVSSAGVTRVIQTMFEPDADETLCLSVVLSGEYGLDDICLSAPVTLSPAGVNEVVEWKLTDEEQLALEAAHDIVRDDIRSI